MSVTPDLPCVQVLVSVGLIIHKNYMCFFTNMPFAMFLFLLLTCTRA